jgi:hypothetical protein
MTEQINERRPSSEHPKDGLNRFLAPSMRDRNKNRRRFGAVTIERGGTYNNEDES